MDMKNIGKSTILRYIIYLIVVALFNLFFFGLSGVKHPASVWISYGFIHWAFAISIATPFLTEKGRDRVTFLFPMQMITAGYFVLELVIGVIFILLAMSKYKLSLYTQITLAAIDVILLLINMIANDHTAKQTEQRQENLQFIRGSCAQLQGIVDCLKGKETQNKVKKVYDVINSSAVKSHESVKAVENRVAEEITRLSYLADGDEQENREEIFLVCDKIIRLANERNRTLKLHN